jgi:hypothetical protein
MVYDCINSKPMNAQDVFIKMAVSAWHTQNTSVKKLLDTLTDDKLMSETAPGRNRGIYLIGHLISVSDGILPLLGFGEKMYPQLEEVFLKNGDNPAAVMPTLNELKKLWNDVHNRLSDHIGLLKSDEWFTRHTAVSESDFAKEPHRNKLNILINRANHTSYHLGQLVYLDKKVHSQ